MDFSLNGSGLKALVFRTERQNEIWIHADQIRRERTGIHATIEFRLDTTILAWSHFNIERDEDRTRLSNKAYRGLGAVIDPNIYPKEYLAHDLDIFCRDLWAEHIAMAMPSEIEGDAVGQPLQFTLKPYVVEGGGTILFGPPGRGKSYTGQLMAVSADAGITDLWQVEQTKVFYINLERSAISIRRRIGSVNTALGLNPGRRLLVMNARGKSLSDLVDVAKKTIEKYGVGFTVLDSISRSGLGDLNENRAMNVIIDTLNNLCPTWLALAHTPRQDETHAYGSMMQDAGADVMVQLLSQLKGAQALGVGLQVTKANDMAPQSLTIYSYGFDTYGLKEARVAKPREYLDIEARRKVETIPAIQEYLLDMGPSTVEDIAEHLGKERSTVQRILAKTSTFTVKGHTGKAQLWDIRGGS